jgi:hypothetical protein
MIARERNRATSEHLSQPSRIEAGAGHALSNAAVFEEIPFQPLEFLIRKVTGHLGYPDKDIGVNFRLGVVDTLPKGFIRLVGQAVEFP